MSHSQLLIQSIKKIIISNISSSTENKENHRQSSRTHNTHQMQIRLTFQRHPIRMAQISKFPSSCLYICFSILVSYNIKCYTKFYYIIQMQKSDSQPEQVPQKEQYKVQKQTPFKKITPNLIMRTSLENSDIQKLSQQQKVNVLLNIRSIHLHWQNISVIENLQVYTKLNILYLQHNKITKMQGLETLINLEYLSLNNNMIEVVEGINRLPKLAGLNLSHNKIEQITGKQFPEKLQLLSLTQNPVTYNGNFKQIIIKNLKHLDHLDGQQLDAETKFKLLGIFPNKLSKYSESLKKFKQQKQKKQKNQQIFVGRGMIDQDQIVKSLRQKTMKILQQSHRIGEQKQNQQIANFKEKIAVSNKLKKIRQDNKVIKQEPQQQN